jgi:hypothetical protein
VQDLQASILEEETGVVRSTQVVLVRRDRGYSKSVPLVGVLACQKEARTGRQFPSRVVRMLVGESHYIGLKVAQIVDGAVQSVGMGLPVVHEDRCPIRGSENEGGVAQIVDCRRR